MLPAVHENVDMHVPALVRTGKDKLRLYVALTAYADRLGNRLKFGISVAVDPSSVTLDETRMTITFSSTLDFTSSTV